MCIKIENSWIGLRHPTGIRWMTAAKTTVRYKSSTLAFTEKTVGLIFLVALAHVLLPAQLLSYCNIRKQVRAGCVDKENNLGSPCAHSQVWHLKLIKNNNHNIKLYDVYINILKGMWKYFSFRIKYLLKIYKIVHLRHNTDSDANFLWGQRWWKSSSYLTQKKYKDRQHIYIFPFITQISCTSDFLLGQRFCRLSTAIEIWHFRSL